LNQVFWTRNNALEVVDGCDVVIGSRFLNDKSNSPKYRNTGIRIITKSSNIETKFKVTDAQSGFRAYLKKVIQEINPTEKGMSVSTEILQKASNRGLTLARVPISVSCGKDTSEQNPVPHGVSVLMNTLKFISVRHPLPFYGFSGIALFIAGLVMGGIFLDAFLNDQTVFYGSLLAAIVLFLLGTILVATSIILFSMETLMRRNRVGKFMPKNSMENPTYFHNILQIFVTNDSLIAPKL